MRGPDFVPAQTPLAIQDAIRMRLSIRTGENIHH